MKALIISISLFIVICLFIGIHSYIMFSLSGDITKKCEETISLVNSEDWDGAVKKIDEIHSTWEKKRMWAALTISTHNIEEIEISLKQSRAFANLHQKADFFGEFTMFTMLIDHIPHQEGFHIEEIL